ncbi:MAG: hypothetical protein JO288_21325 [Hyphomicrobiales bacterium]|nr:hypothetical protein [Hyphomicrobiales bacterium]
MVWLVDRPILFFCVTLVLLWGAAELGVLVRFRVHKLTPAERSEFDLVRNAMFTLLGLIVGFAISMAVSRYDLRKTYEEAEANAVGTEYLRLELMPPEIAAAARALLKTYAEERVAFYKERDPERQSRNEAETALTQNALWRAIAPEAKTAQTPINALVASGMNDVLNSQGYTLAAWRNRLPSEVWLLLIVVAAASSFLIGFGAERLSPVTHAVLPLTAALAFLLIADVEGPHNGLIRVEPVNLEDALAAMRK